MPDGKDISRVLLQKYGMRVEPQMSEYVLRAVERGMHAQMPAIEIPVIGGDARTGVPIRQAIPMDAIRAALNDQLPA